MKDKIEKILLYLGISHSQFADELGVQRSGISHILSERNKPSLEFIQKVLSKYKEINPEWLITGKGEMLRTSVQRSLFSQAIEFPEEKIITPSQEETQKSSIPVEENKIIDLTKGTILSEIEQKPLNIKVSEEDTNVIKVFSENKEIEKIVLFYKDKSFCVYKPE